MSVKAKIISGQGQPWAVGVTRDQALKVGAMPVRRTEMDAALITAEKLYREFFTLGSTSNTAMNVLGSTAAPQLFTIESKSDRCLSIYGLRMLFESTNMDVSGNENRRFGAASTIALANGLTLYALQGGVMTQLFLEPVRTVGDFFSYTETFVNRVDGVTSNTDLLNVRIDFEVPVVLPAGSTDRLVFSVNDDLRALLQFKTMVFGTQELVR